MLKYFSSFIWGKPQEEISLDQALDILQFDETDSDTYKTPAEDVIEEPSDYNIHSKVGYITYHSNNEFMIDGTYYFNSNSINLNVGSKVSYKIYASDGEIKVGDVILIENDWDVSESNSKSNWCHRTIVCKVEERSMRQITANPGNIKINLDDVASEFVPVVGDWLQLDVKCEVDESAVDLSGTVLEINKILPMRPEVKIGKVTLWNSQEQSGTIDHRIYFDKDSLSGGYVPVNGDKVIVEVIESNQGRCTMRALKVLPEYLKFNTKPFDNIESLELEQNIEGIDIQNDITLNFTVLNETRTFSVEVFNSTEADITLQRVEFPRENTCCALTTAVSDALVRAGSSYTVNCECFCRTAGCTRDCILFHFDKGTVGRWIDININAFNSHTRTTGKYNKQIYNKVAPKNQNIIRGQRVVQAPRFVANRMLDYMLPQRLLNIVTKYATTYLESAQLKDELVVIKPSLASNLSFQNYLDKFHTLLHLEEIEEIIQIRNYDQEKACFIPNAEYLMLEIENLSERRPSIIVGDRVFAKDPSGSQKSDWEGYVHKVGAKHLYIKFSPIFHDSYNGEDYSIHIVASRTSIRRLHQAVDLAVRHLGVDVLFPSKVVTKPSQVTLNTCDKSPESNRKIFIKKLMEYKSKSPSEQAAALSYFQQEVSLKDGINLEWYDANLNCYQKQAVKNILLGVARPLPYIIFGPPGTGKTVTLIETILQILRLMPHARLLVAAPSNSASDLLALRLIGSGVLKPGDLVRLVSNTYATSSLIPPILAPFCATGNIAAENSSDDKSTIADSGLHLGVNSAVLGRHRITVSTCGSAAVLNSMGFPKGHFTHIIVDEAGQAMEPEVLIPLSFLDTSSGQAILAGDPLQLGPVIMSKISEECGLAESYLERIINRFPYVRDPQGFPQSGGYDPRLVTKLLYNYRSLPQLLKLTSSLFYNDDLIPTISPVESKEAKTLSSLREILPKGKVGTEVPSIVFHGINGENFQTPDSPSWFNPSEASQIFYYVNELYRLGLTSKDIGIISPYIKQVKEIRSILTEAEFDIPKIGTVEEFQGQEFNVVLLSTVRSSHNYVTSDIRHSLGFISSPRRLNVAISRAKILLIVVGNPAVLYYDKYWQTVLNYAQEIEGYTGYHLTG